ncbi:MAG: DNA polymerase III subunit delta [Candidatus Solibacter usitatus]|nr:DNA polymerase III subunit delta [Candidatus Solibacter usitatus]
MTPQQLLTQIKSGSLGSVYLFTGPELYRRRVCRKHLIEGFLSAEQREEGLTKHDLDEISLRDVLDDARSLSLFAAKRVIWVSAAESALPRGAALTAGDPSMEALASYVRNPTPDVIVVFDCIRYGFDGEDKSRMERLRKFYTPVPVVVEFAPYSEDEARKLAADLAKRAGVSIAPDVLDLLVESLGHDASRIASELEKLALFTGGARAVTMDDLAALTPDARTATVFELVNAVARRDRARSLDLLETLVQSGEYLPLALSFLATQFRLALAAKEEGLRSPQQLQAHCTKLGVPMWFARAQQVMGTASAFNRQQLQRGLGQLYEADKAFRDRSPDDRIVMEKLILGLTV